MKEAFRPSPAPSRLEPLNATEMLLAWNTGESYALAYPELRFQCPCASCVDEHTGQRIITRGQVPAAIRVIGAQVVGRYAVQISFSDAHSTGIFHFDTLYRLCQESGRRLAA